MSTSIIQQKISEPEYITQEVKGYAAFHYAGGSISVTPYLTSGINSITINASSNTVSSATYNVAKSGYTLVGITYTTSQAYSPSHDYCAGFSTRRDSTTTEIPARITVSGNNLILTPCSKDSVSSGERATTTISMSAADSATVYLGKIICKYIKN